MADHFHARFLLGLFAAERASSSVFFREVRASVIQFFEALGVQVFPGLRGVWLNLGQRDGMELIRGIRCHEEFLLPVGKAVKS
jgi:hypothetical protein